MSKQEAYEALVAKRKSFKFADGLTNPADTPFDVDEIEPWAQWQNNLNATVLVVGQEFSDVGTYIKTEGKVERYPEKYEYPLNKNLNEFCSLIGLDVGHPYAPNRTNPVFFTNAVMALKSGAMSANFKDSWLKESREEFLQPLIEIIRPKVIIPIGTKATLSLGKTYGFPVGSHADMVRTSPVCVVGGPMIFPVYHTGGLGLRNRSKLLQIEDWKRIKDHLSLS